MTPKWEINIYFNSQKKRCKHSSIKSYQSVHNTQTNRSQNSNLLNSIRICMKLESMKKHRKYINLTFPSRMKFKRIHRCIVMPYERLCRNSREKLGILLIVVKWFGVQKVSILSSKSNVDSNTSSRPITYKPTSSKQNK